MSKPDNGVEAIAIHSVQQLGVAQTVSPASAFSIVRHTGHTLCATSQDHLGAAEQDLLAAMMIARKPEPQA